MFVSPQKSYIEAIILNVVIFEGGAFGRSLVHEIRALRKGISALRRRDKKDMISLHHVRTSKKVAICKPGKGLSPGTKLASTLKLDFPAYFQKCEK